MSETRVLWTRRQMLRSAAAAGASLALPYLLPGRVLGLDGTVAPSERIVMAGLGIGPRGQADMRNFLQNADAQCIAVCDTREERRQAIKTMVDEHYGNNDCATYRDMFELLARPDLDAVLIATGDRWHTLASIIAAKAGKDIYCEKPCSTSIAESRALADTINRYGRVYQAGTQRRTIGNFLLATELVRRGKLDKLHTVHANTLAPGTSHDWLPAEPEPPKEVVDWDRWLGPCPWRPFNARYVKGGWRGFFDFHGGGILEWGAHTVDLCQWVADRDHTTPVTYEPTDDGCIATYADGLKMVMRPTGWMGLGTCSVRFEGDAGWIETGDSGKIALSPSLQSEMRYFTTAGTDPANHVRNFLDCVKSRAMAAANADVAARSHIVCHAAYIAWQLKRTLTLDPVKEAFVGDEEANRMRTRAYREPWRI